jgi:hypothetical protein
MVWVLMAWVLDDLAAYYDTHDTAAEMEYGRWVDPRPMKTTSLRLPANVVEALKARAHRRGMRYTALLREIVERAVRSEGTEGDGGRRRAGPDQPTVSPKAV